MQNGTDAPKEKWDESSVDEVNLWIKKLNARNRIIRRNAACALGDIGNEKAVDPLIAAMHDTDSYVRGRATSALCKIGEKAVGPLIATLHDEDPNVRWRAVCALGSIGNVKAIPHLEKIVDDMGTGYRSSNRTIGDDAQEAIEKIKLKNKPE